MDFKKLLNDNITDSIYGPGSSYNLRQFGPYQLRTTVERVPDYSGSVVRHSVDLPQNEQPNQEMANLIAKELNVDPQNIFNINPGSSWVKGNTDIVSPNADQKRFQRINEILKNK